MSVRLQAIIVAALLIGELTAVAAAPRNDCTPSNLDYLALASLADSSQPLAMAGFRHIPARRAMAARTMR